MSKTKRDSNNFITLILSKIELARNFHQRVDLSITCRTVLGHAKLKFYLRRRYKELYLYIRLNADNFTSTNKRHSFMTDLILLNPGFKMESTQGHYYGLSIHLTHENHDRLIKFLKLIAVLSKPKNFYVKNTKIYKSFRNYEHTSELPIHLQYTQSELLYLKNLQIIELFYKDIKEYDKKNASNINTNINNTIDNNV